MPPLPPGDVHRQPRRPVHPAPQNHALDKRRYRRRLIPARPIFFRAGSGEIEQGTWGGVATLSHMTGQVREAWVAFTYAWWLTGDDAAAGAAVRAAVREPEVVHKRGQQQLVALLREVRAAAITEPTICPATELAFLHDGHGVPLPAAADLAEVDPADAATELAHGRLEALVETFREPVTHPERLGGLALGNAPDVAHSRQCDACAGVRDAMARGRRELRQLPVRQPPKDVADAMGDAMGDAIEERTPLERDTDQEQPAATPPSHFGMLVAAVTLAVVLVVVLIWAGTTVG